MITIENRNQIDFGKPVFKFYLPEIHANQSFRFKKIDSSDVIREIKNFKLQRASGHDFISARNMKKNTHILAPILTNLLNQMFEQSVQCFWTA